MATDTLIDELVVRGADDWVTAAEVAWVAKSAGKARSDDHIEVLSLDLISSVLQAGLMEAGDVTDGGFFAWDISPSDATVRIKRAWEQLGHPPNLGEVCWLANTEVGDQRAHAIVTNRGRDSRGA